MAELPAGRVTILFTDIEGSTRLLHALGDRYARVLADHRRLLRESFARHGGVEVDTQGDSFFVAFSDPSKAVAAAEEGQRALGTYAWPDGTAVRVRMGVHTGEPLVADGHYVGIDVHRGARIAAAAHGGQVIVSERTSELISGRRAPPGTLRDLGVHRLKDLPEPERLFQLVADGLRSAFPPLRVEQEAIEAAGLPDYSLPPADVPCPYKGLLPFEPEDSELFFGREQLAEDLAARLTESSFLAVVGPSGSGKSSLVRAGVVPALQRASGNGLHTAIFSPGSHPLAQLAGARDASLLVVDQFEEVFTLCREEEERRDFIDALLEAAAHDARVVIALRADFYGHCATYPRLASALEERQALVGPMTEEELRRAIERPAEHAGLLLEPGVVEGILRDVVGRPGALPLLSHSLLETWKHRSGRMLTLIGYLQSGGVQGAIAQTAETVYRDALSAEQQALARNAFLRLTELGEGTEDTRRRVSIVELVPRPEQEAEVHEVLRTLADARLVTIGERTVEVAHEALIRHWPTLRAWLNEDREGRLLHRRLTESAQEWERLDRDPGTLFRGSRLATTGDWATAHDPELNELEREFLTASRQASEREAERQRRGNRRLRILLAGVAAALVAALIAGSFAVVQRGRARHSATVAQAGRLAAQSREVAAKHPDLALLLSLEALRLDDSVDSRGTLLGALEHGSQIRAWLQGFHTPVEATAFSPDGKLLASVTLDGTTLWDTATWRPVGPPLRSSQGGWQGVDFSPDGRTLAIAGGKGRVELWDVSTRKELRELTDPAATPREPQLSLVRYSPDGSVIAAGPQETNHVTLWATTSGQVIGRPITTNPPGSGAQSISFSPDSKRIAVPAAPGTVGIWEVATGHRVGEPLEIGSAGVEAAIFAAGGRTLIASDDSGSVSIIDIRTGRPVRPSLSVGNKPAASLDLSPDGRLLAAASFVGSVFVWDVKTGAPYGPTLTADTSPVSDVVFSPDGRTLVSSHLRSAVVWNMNGDQVIGEPLGGPTNLTTDVSFSNDGKRLAAGQFDGSTIVFDTQTRREALRIDIGSVVTAVAFHPDGNLIAVGTIDGKVRFFDPKRGAAVGSLLGGGRSAVWQIAFSPDGRLLAVAVDPNGVDGFSGQQRQGEVQLWDVHSRSRVGRAIAPGGGSVLSAAFNRDGTLLATGSYGGRLDLWDVPTQASHGKPMRVADDGFPSVAIDPSGGLVAGGGAIGPVRVWRVADQRPAFPPLSGHTGPVTGVAFDPAGSFLATTSPFGATRLWDPATGLGYGDELVASPRPGSLISSIDLPPFLGLRNAFSPDGKLLAAAGVETLAMLWDVDPAVWRQRACAIVGRNLSREEWRLYLPPGTRYRATCSEWPTG
jgi:WD40 repeat protein/class 3 adenylate cyclase/energy-coupling factor transporter ATP-binding protein EcfA2